jgi:cytoskeletal protein RodZ
VRFLERLNSPTALVVAVVVFLVLNGFLLYRYQQSLRSTEQSTPNAPTQETTAPSKAETTGTEKTAPSPKVETTTAEETTSSLEEDGVRVVVEVAGAGGVGLSILEDGQLAYDQVAGSGFSEEFEAEEAITVTTADAGSVQVEVNGGDPGPLGASGEQVIRTFTPED